MPATPAAAEQLVPVRRALLSVSDKTGLADFAAALHHEFGVALVSTGGTAKFLREAGLPVTDVADVTGFPEMMDGRVKTLHPKVHGGLLALRDHADHLASMTAHGIAPIDLVCINLYPFAETVAKPGVTFDDAVENIDIGGPAMIRSAAKNHAWVVVVTSPGRYDKVLGDLRKHGGRSCARLRLKQCQSAFAHTAEYDGRIAAYLATQITSEVASVGSRPLEVATLSSMVQMFGSEEWTPAVTRLLVEQAVAVGGTEAAAFRVQRMSKSDGSAATTLKPEAHIRTDGADTDARRRSFDLLGKWAALRFSEGSDDAVLIARPPANGFDSQYCLVTLIRDEVEVVAVSTVVTRARYPEDARDKLGRMRVVADAWLANRGTTATPTHPSHRVELLPADFLLSLSKRQDLRYGENPHQKAALYVGPKPREASVAFATQHHGKELSYINLLDADGALACVKEFAAPAACIVKHTTPCGCATADDLATAFGRAYAGDPLAAFGGIVAVNKPVDLAAAEAITSIDKLLEVIVAPYYAEDALDLLRSRWKNVRLLEVGPIVQGDGAQIARRDTSEVNLHKITGGYLVQERDLLGLDETAWRVASKRQPTPAEMADLRFAWLVCKHVKSNAIVVCKGGMLLGAGAGQMDRPSAARLAVSKAADRIGGSVAASDAFFPFPDGPALLLEAGVTAIIHPGGSLKDQDTIDLVDRHGAALVLTGQRHFKH